VKGKKKYKKVFESSFLKVYINNMKIEIRSGYEGIAGYVLEKEYSIEMERYCERDILKKVLLNEFESEEGVVEYWKGIDCDLNSVEDVIEYIVYDKEEMEKMGLYVSLMERRKKNEN